jgi:hypothetical protein
MGFTSKVKSTNNLNNLIRKLQGLDGKESVAGYDDEPHPVADMSYAELADLHEVGSEHLPRRQFMTQAYHDGLADHDLSIQVVREIIYGKSNAKTQLTKLSKELAELISTSIRRGDFAALSPVTIRLKGGNTKPLRDSDSLMNNVKSSVEDTEGF